MAYSHEFFTAFLLGMAVFGLAQDVTTVPSVTTIAPKVTFIQTIPVLVIPGLSTTITQSESAGPLVPISDITSIPVDTGKPPGPPALTDSPKTTDTAVMTSTIQRSFTTTQSTPVSLTDKATLNTATGTSSTSESGQSQTASSTATTTASPSKTPNLTAEKKKDKNILLGSVIGGIAFVAIVVTVLIMYRRGNRKSKKKTSDLKGKGRATNPGNTATLEQPNPRYSLAYGTAKVSSWMGKTAEPKRRGKDLERGRSTKTFHTAGTLLSNSVAETPSEYYPRVNSIPPNSPLNTLSTQSTFAPYRTSPSTIHDSSPSPEQKARVDGIDWYAPKRPVRPQSLTPEIIDLMDRIPSPISTPFDDEIRDSVAELKSPQTPQGRFPTPSLEAQILNTRAYQKPKVNTPYNGHPEAPRSLTNSPEGTRSERALSPDPLNIVKAYVDRKPSDSTAHMSKVTRSGSPNHPSPPNVPSRIRDSEKIDPDRRESHINHTMDALEGRPPRSRIANRHRYPASSVYSRQLDGVTMIPQGYRQSPITGKHTGVKGWVPNDDGKPI